MLYSPARVILWRSCITDPSTRPWRTSQEPCLDQSPAGKKLTKVGLTCLLSRIGRACRTIPRYRRITGSSRPLEGELASNSKQCGNPRCPGPRGQLEMLPLEEELASNSRPTTGEATCTCDARPDALEREKRAGPGHLGVHV